MAKYKCVSCENDSNSRICTLEVSDDGEAPMDCPYGRTIVNGYNNARINRARSDGMDLKELQSNASAWSKRNFGPHYGTGYRNLLGVSEEVGELCHAHLKGEQGIRHTPDEILAMKKDAVGDIVIFLCNYCDSQGISINDCVETAWNEIKNRDWSKQHGEE